MSLLLWGVAGVVVVVLAIVAGYFQYRVYKMEQQKKSQQQTLEKLQNDHQQYLKNSIRVLAQGIVDDQVSLTEGAIRISVLLDNLKISDAQREQYSVFFQLAEATSHIPILKEWKQLSKKQKRTFDKERRVIEEKFDPFMIDAATQIQTELELL